jgi:hypothetical protein
MKTKLATQRRWLLSTLCTIAIVAIVGILSVCSGDDGGTTTISVTGVEINKSNLSLNVGSSETLTAMVAPINATKKTVTWSTSNATVATVANGLVTAIAKGTATIIVTTADGKKTDTCAVSVYAIDPSKTPIIEAEIDMTIPTNGGIPVTTVSGETEHFTAGNITWSPDDNPFKPNTEYTATVILTAKSAYTFTASTTATVNGQTATISDNTGGTVKLTYKFLATSTKNVSDMAIKSPPNNLTYIHGDKLDLSGMVVTLTYDDAATEDITATNFMAKGITASPSDGDNLAHSTHNGKPVTIIYGSLQKTTDNLTVNVKNASTLTINEIQTQTYTGSEIKPAVTVKDGIVTLRLGNDYTVSYGNNTNAGTATVTITGTGDYTGSKTANFTINKADPLVTTWPTAAAINYGAALSTSVLSGGASTPVGNFAWTNGTTIPTVTNNGYSVTFTPTDTTNYNTTTGNVSVTVIFINIADLETWLSSQPYNTSDTTYKITLNVSDIGGDSQKSGSVGNVIYTNYKYVSLDLSGSTFTSIDNEAFQYCYMITDITIPDGVIYIGESAFRHCISLTSINIPDSVTSMDGQMIFYDCTNLTSITIPDNVTSIGSCAFARCTSLTSVTIGNKVIYFDSEVFLNCTSLTNVTIPDSVEIINYSTFAYCTSLTSVTIPNSVTAIGGLAFSGCTSLTSVTFASGDNITYFGDDAFPEGSDGNGGNTLQTAYSTGKAGTYSREANGSIWTKQP